MKVVLLAGGFGTRISEESHLKPKPMIEIGDKPILWHVMKQYSYYGFNEFIICLGYKANVIKEFFANYYLYTSDITFDLENNNMTIHNSFTEPWKVTLVDTGLNTMTGGRIKRIKEYVGDETFLLTYGDGVSNVNIKDLVEFHKQNNRIGTMTVTNVEQRFGVIDLGEDHDVRSFREKADTDGALVNIGFMVMEPQIFDYIEGDEMPFERYPLEQLAAEGQLSAYFHDGFWQCMDTQRDKMKLEELWKSGNAPWRMQ